MILCETLPLRAGKSRYCAKHISSMLELEDPLQHQHCIPKLHWCCHHCHHHCHHHRCHCHHHYDQTQLCLLPLSDWCKSVRQGPLYIAYKRKKEVEREHLYCCSGWNTQSHVQWMMHQQIQPLRPAGIWILPVNPGINMISGLGDDF